MVLFFCTAQKNDILDDLLDTQDEDEFSVELAGRMVGCPGIGYRMTFNPKPAADNPATDIEQLKSFKRKQSSRTEAIRHNLTAQSKRRRRCDSDNSDVKSISKEETDLVSKTLSPAKSGSSIELSHLRARDSPHSESSTNPHPDMIDCGSSDTCSCANHSSVEGEPGELSDSSDVQRPPTGTLGSTKRNHTTQKQCTQKTSNDKITMAANGSEADRNECEDASKRNLRQNHQSHKTMHKEKRRKRDYPSLVKYFFKDACYFLMKSNNRDNIDLSKAKGVWSTPLQNESKLNRAFRHFSNVILVFSVKQSGAFQGFARLSSESDSDPDHQIDWVLPQGLSKRSLGGVFNIDWICTNELVFSETLHLYNPLNESKPVKVARDGQEIDERVGRELCRLFPPDETTDLISIIKFMKSQIKHRSKLNQSRRNDYHHDGISRKDHTSSSSQSSYYSGRQRASLQKHGINHVSRSLAYDYNHHSADLYGSYNSYSHQASSTAAYPDYNHIRGNGGPYRQPGYSYSSERGHNTISSKYNNFYDYPRPIHTTRSAPSNAHRLSNYRDRRRM